MRRLLMIGLTFLAVPGWAQAAHRVATDHRSGVEFRLDGRLLTATIVPQPQHDPPDARAAIMGRRVTAACGTRLPEQKGRSAFQNKRWPLAHLALKFRLPRDVSADVRWCVLEDAHGADIARVFFPRYG